ncbi:glycosyltransferase [Aureimonas sp. ME7]|uniref:glycosyltransferase n=1 Tax=Aureimonas sp. ME7 TaxID=2744252 RepID=UPI0015FAD655|nr:glycosyltransferase [Aureimonas sp. ME7]
MTPASGARRVLLAIPTHRRPDGLARLLAAAAALDVPDDVALEVMAFDNDPAGGQALPVIEAARAGGFPFPLACLPVPEKGLCHVRNAIVDTARAAGRFDHLAMIDDDEWFAPDWLRVILGVHEATGADATSGPFEPVFPPDTPEWIRLCPLYRSDPNPTGPIDMIWGAGNVVLRMASLADVPPGQAFDLRFNLLGGEDVEAFTRLKRQGFRYAWAAGAPIFEEVPPARTRLAWIVKRAFRIGTTGMAVQLDWDYRGRFGRLRALGFSLAQLGLYGAKLTRSLAHPERRIANVCHLVRVTGKIANLTGLTYREYR